MSELDVRDRILQAAATCFLENDYKKVTTREIAKRADANPAMINYYFGSKSQLFEAVIKEHFAEIYRSLDVSGKQTSLEEGLFESWDVYYRVMSSNPELPRLMVRALVYGDVPGHDYLVDNILGRKMGGFVNDIRAGQQSGRVRGDVSAKHVWLMCASIAMMPVVFRSIGATLLDGEQEADLQELAEVASRVIGRGLSAS